jgi:putative hemolysin
MSYLIEIAIIILLIVLNGILSLSEFAIVSARRAQLRQRADEGDAGAAVALERAEEPTPFLSTIQIGITLVGILAGAYGGATVAEGLAASFTAFPALAPYAGALGNTLVVLVITYCTLIFGELVPKRIALNNPEDIASAVSKPMRILSLASAPLVFMLSRSTEAVLGIMGIRESTGSPVTEEEIKIMLEEGTEAGIFEKAELSMVQGVFGLGDRRIESLMTPRYEIVALDLDDPDAENLKKMVRSGRSSFPAYEEDLDAVVGMVSVKDVLASLVERGSSDVRGAVTAPLFVPESTPALNVLELFKETGMHIALVTDEYGNVTGLVTLHDILEAIVGDVRIPGEPEETPVVVREDGSWLIDGSTPIEEVKDVLGVKRFPGEAEGHYRTVAGLIMYALNRIPATGDRIVIGDLRYEVVDMDGNRVDKVMVARVPPALSD